MEIEISAQDRDRWEGMVAYWRCPTSVLRELGVRATTRQLFQRVKLE